MFLVTTADQRFWKTDEEILFLGEWCKIYSQKHVWGKLNHRTLPYHWDVREKLIEDFRYVESLYAKQLTFLSAKLNEIHNVDQSTRYWEILIGPWLFFAIPILFDRYLSIKSAIDSGLVTNTWIDSSLPKSSIAKNSGEFESWCWTDQFNHYLYGSIIKHLGPVPFELKNINEKDFLNEENYSISQGFFVQFAKNTLQSIQKIFPKENQEVFFFGSHLSFWNLARLQLSLGQFPYLFPPSLSPEVFPINVVLRDKIKISNIETPFEIILQKLIPELMPTVYLEGFSRMKQESNDQFPKTSKGIFTAHGLYVDEGFKFWAADQIDSGANLLMLQHGGVYGISGWSQFENFEIDISDKFYTWGWENDSSKTISMESWYLTNLANKIKPDPNGNILFVSFDAPRYCVNINPRPHGPQVLDYIKEQERFVKSVAHRVHDLLLIKLPKLERGWKMKERWNDFSPSLNIYSGNKGAVNLLNKCRLCIHTYNSTGYLESFSLNFPTLVFWNPKHWELRDSAKPYFDHLRRVGVFHDTPESAAAKMNEIYQNPMSWWMTPEIQKAKNDFCRQFAWTARDWRSDWKKELLKRAVE